MFTLKAGDKVGIASPAGLLNSPEEIKLPLDYLEALGFECILGKHVFDQNYYMAGTDKNRAADLHDFFKNPEIKAIFTTAGGCGSQRLLPLLDYDLIKNNPKPVFGLSDNTALQTGIYTQSGIPSVTGFSLKYDFKTGHINELLEQSLKAVINGEKQTITSGETLTRGTAEGTLIGGCLSLVRSLCGTPYFPDLKDKILLLEDVGEKTYKLDLMLTQLRQQSGFGKIKGIIFGIFAGCEEADDGDGSVDDILKNFVSELPQDIPVIKNFLYGHIPGRYVLPVGTNVRINADKCLLEYL